MVAQNSRKQVATHHQAFFAKSAKPRCLIVNTVHMYPDPITRGGLIFLLALSALLMAFGGFLIANPQRKVATDLAAYEAMTGVLAAADPRGGRPPSRVEFTLLGSETVYLCRGVPDAVVRSAWAPGRTQLSFHLERTSMGSLGKPLPVEVFGLRFDGQQHRSIQQDIDDRNFVGRDFVGPFVLGLGLLGAFVHIFAYSKQQALFARLRSRR
jgi:hypothetical protein